MAIAARHKIVERTACFLACRKVTNALDLSDRETGSADNSADFRGSAAHAG
jgi:hypothetical protein